jgi:polygalacturonase
MTVVMHFTCLSASEAKDYNASLFGIKSDGVTLNTGSIQKAIDFISGQGGGRLMFYVGRYLTGAVALKSNVSIRLEEGAVLVGVPSIYDYFSNGEFISMLYGENLKNVSITGKGVITGNGHALLGARTGQVKNGYIQNEDNAAAPGLIQLKDCENVTISGIVFRNSLGDAIRLDKTTNASVDSVTVQNKRLPGSALNLSNNSHLSVLNSYFETSGKEIIYTGSNQDIRIEGTKNSAGKKLRKP